MTQQWISYYAKGVTNEMSKVKFGYKKTDQIIASVEFLSSFLKRNISISARVHPEFS
jgi:hypothetical protein